MRETLLIRKRPTPAQLDYWPAMLSGIKTRLRVNAPWLSLFSGNVFLRFLLIRSEHKTLWKRLDSWPPPIQGQVTGEANVSD